jgi:hypothetical protein
LKNILLFASVVGLLGGMTAVGQEKTADPQLVPVSFSAQPASYSPNDMKIVGTLNSGETSKPVEYSRTPEYRAFVFEGNGHDLVQVTVTGANRKAVIALADSTLKPIATGVGQLSAALPYHGPDTEAFYILFKGSANQPARLTVHLKKTPGSAQPSDATR